jgi:hypothetical protein
VAATGAVTGLLGFSFAAGVAVIILLALAFTEQFGKVCAKANGEPKITGLSRNPAEEKSC